MAEQRQHHADGQRDQPGELGAERQDGIVGGRLGAREGGHGNGSHDQTEDADRPLGDIGRHGVVAQAAFAEGGADEHAVDISQQHLQHIGAGDGNAEAEGGAHDRAVPAEVQATLREDVEHRHLDRHADGRADGQGEDADVRAEEQAQGQAVADDEVGDGGEEEAALVHRPHQDSLRDDRKTADEDHDRVDAHQWGRRVAAHHMCDGGGEDHQEERTDGAEDHAERGDGGCLALHLLVGAADQVGSQTHVDQGQQHLSDGEGDGEDAHAHRTDDVGHQNADEERSGTCDDVAEHAPLGAVLDVVRQIFVCSLGCDGFGGISFRTAITGDGSTRLATLCHNFLPSVVGRLHVQGCPTRWHGLASMDVHWCP